MTRSPRRLLALAILVLVAARALQAAPPRVDLEVGLEDGSVGTDTSAWSDMLNRAGFSSVRIRAAGSDSPLLQTKGTAELPSYRVVGILTSDNLLILPKGRFKLSDRSALEQWVTRLRDGGEDGVNLKPAAFGLLPKQLFAVHQDLTKPVAASTLGKHPRDAARDIAAGLTLKFTSDVACQQALASGENVADELQGVSSGTALAAILRPVGLAIVPEKNGAEARLRIASATAAKEFWPVGWPLKGNPRETLPELFKFLKIEIVDTPLNEGLTAIAGRLRVPLLVDHNAIVRDKIDLSRKVSHSSPSTYYSLALDRLLIQARLKSELRIDEADKPLLWVTTIRQ
jgi:hypothetical protein